MQAEAYLIGRIGDAAAMRYLEWLELSGVPYSQRLRLK